MTSYRFVATFTISRGQNQQDAYGRLLSVLRGLPNVIRLDSLDPVDEANEEDR